MELLLYRNISLKTPFVFVIYEEYIMFFFTCEKSQDKQIQRNTVASHDQRTHARTRTHTFLLWFGLPSAFRWVRSVVTYLEFSSVFPRPWMMSCSCIFIYCGEPSRREEPPSVSVKKTHQAFIKQNSAWMIAFKRSVLIETSFSWFTLNMLYR